MRKNSPAPPRFRATLNDVAEMADVSASTASLVLAGKAVERRISEATCRRVREAASLLGYTPSLLHRSMRRGRTHVLSFCAGFHGHGADDLWTQRFGAALTQASARRGYDVLVHGNAARRPEATFESLNGGLSDGVILLAPPPNDPLLLRLRESSLPTVVVDPRDPEETLSWVRADRNGGLGLLAEALAAQGHERIAAIMEDAGTESAGAEGAGGDLEPLRRVHRLEDRLAGRATVRTVVRRGSVGATLERALAFGPTALFAWHDRLAYAVVEACEAAGMRVPEELSLVGYDGLVWPSTSRHRVASVQVPIQAMAEAAVGLLHRLAEGEGDPFRETLPVGLFPGTTLGPARS